MLCIWDMHILDFALVASVSVSSTQILIGTLSFVIGQFWTVSASATLLLCWSRGTS